MLYACSRGSHHLLFFASFGLTRMRNFFGIHNLSNTCNYIYIYVYIYMYIIYIYILMLVTCHVPRAALWFHRVVLRFDICTMILFLFLFDFLLLLCLFCPLRCFGRFGLFTFRRLPAPYMSLQKLTCMESMEG